MLIYPNPPAEPTPVTFSVDLQWTAPGDDGNVGGGHLYDLRMSTQPITSANFGAAIQVTGLQKPSLAGSRERFSVTGLESGTTYYFAIKTRDEAGNWSPMSNVVTFPTQTTGVGDLAVDLEFSAPWPNPARSGTRWAFAMPHGGMIQVDVFSESGRRVRQLANGWRPAGRGELTWDLRDDTGRAEPSGVYLVRAQLGGRHWTRTLAVVR
jgi:hypothetical protein